jgi:hypothetical protein
MLDWAGLGWAGLGWQTVSAGGIPAVRRLPPAAAEAFPAAVLLCLGVSFLAGCLTNDNDDVCVCVCVCVCGGRYLFKRALQAHPRSRYAHLAWAMWERQQGNKQVRAGQGRGRAGEGQGEGEGQGQVRGRGRARARARARGRGGPGPGPGPGAGEGRASCQHGMAAACCP